MSIGRLTAIAVACCIVPLEASAVQFKVLNCTDRRIEAWAYNDNDSLRAIPYKVTSIDSRAQGTVECATTSCSTTFYPVNAPPFSYPTNPSYDFCLAVVGGDVQLLAWGDQSCQPGYCGTRQP